LTPEQYKARNRKLTGEKNALETNTGFTKYDTARLLATAADVASMITSFTPATIASAGIGAAGTTGHLYADQEDGFDLGDVGRAALGYGMDFLSLIPGVGAATKGARIAATLGKYVPRIMAAIGTMHAVSNGPEIIRSLQKIRSDESLTVSDWQNVA
jgi:hypothetical protein